MNREDIIRMAREACDQAPREDWNSTAWVFGDETLERFAALVAAAEREECAKVCEAIDRNGAWVTKLEASAAIRARSKQ
jgi:putative NIF3 family GTP cyclohydrolase 1 type 2